jgi:predicted amidohydrolase
MKVGSFHLPTMKIGLVQTNIAWCDIPTNIARAEALIASSEAADLYILPEMWSTGFVIEAQDVAQTEEQCEALKWMVTTAATRNCAISGSLVISEGEKFYNRHYFITPEGIAARYDKRHLFRLGGETKRFTAGSERVVVEWQGVKFLLQTCYDIRFPVFARNRVAEGVYDYDAIIYIASFPTPRAAAWRTLAMARAIENEAFVFAVNRTGDDIYCHYDGQSAIFDAACGVVAECGAEEQMVVAELDVEALCDYRRRFPTLRDGDDFELYVK